MNVSTRVCCASSVGVASSRGRVVLYLFTLLGLLSSFIARQSFAAVNETSEADNRSLDAKPMVGGGALGIFTFVSETPMLFAGVSVDPGFCFAAGVSFEYARRGLNSETDDKVAVAAAGYVFYAVHNRLPFSFGPEILVSSSVMPSSDRGTVFVQPGLGMYVAPFNAPLVLGSAVSLRIEHDARAGNVAGVATVVPGLRLAWIFP